MKCQQLFIVTSLFIVNVYSEELPDYYSIYRSKLSKANLDFTTELLRTIGVPKYENAMVSPMGLLHGLSVLLLGCRGNTRNELMETLKYSNNFENHTMVHKSFRRFITYMPQYEGHYILRYANRLLVNHDFETNEAYKAGARKYYNASVEDVYFEEDAEVILEETNAWVRNVTRGKIKHLVKNEFRKDALMILLNVVYFKGWWETKFNSDNTVPRVFYVNGEEEKETDFMNQVNSFHCVETEDYLMLRLNYEGDFSFNILLPHKRKGLQKVINEIDSDTLINNVLNMTEKKINLYLPKFKLETTYRITDLLGGNDIFNSDADFTGISDHGNLRVSEGIHKSYVYVSERGTEAAGASVIQIRARSIEDVQTVDVDHPFLFLITHNPTDMVWFAGVVCHFT